MPVGFWDNFFDNDHRQRADINEARADAAAVGYEVSSLRSTVVRMEQKLGDLSILVSVLVRMLEESGHADLKVLRYRVEAELDTIAAARQQFGPTSIGDLRVTAQASASPPEPEAPTTPTTCTKCGRTVPANRTTIMETGVVCDGCAR